MRDRWITEMFHHTRALALLGLLAGCGATRSLPRAAPHAPGDYFPTALGTTWGYRVTLPQQGTVFAVRRVEDHVGDTVRIRFGIESQEYAVRADGVVRAGAYILRMPPHEGASWTIPGGRVTVIATGAPVDVPAGHYDGCILVREESHDAVTETAYAPRVGPVEIRILDRTGGGELAHAVLSGFTPPGSDGLE